MNGAALTLDTLRPAIPEIALSLAICALLLFDVFAGPGRRQLTAMFTLLALALCAWLTATIGAVQSARCCSTACMSRTASGCS